jgi:hypothetical protein
MAVDPDDRAEPRTSLLHGILDPTRQHRYHSITSIRSRRLASELSRNARHSRKDLGRTSALRLGCEPTNLDPVPGNENLKVRMQRYLDARTLRDELVTVVDRAL